MSSLSSPTLDEVVENIVEDVLRERVEQPETQETVPSEEVRKENEEMERAVVDARVFFTNKGVKNFKNILTKKGFV